MKTVKQMKTVKFLALAILVSVVFASCSSDDDDNTPTPVNEEEVITTMTLRLTPESGGTTIIMQTRDLDGDGPDEPVLTEEVTLIAGVTYNGTIELLNETVDPAENITEEVEEENLDHQFFFTTNGQLDLTTSDFNLDSEGNILGTELKLIAGAASSGSLTITLRHEPTKPNTGLEDAGGETDITASFDVIVE